MPEKFDVIIIGGGLAGLVCGAKLSHEGRSVLVVEQHHVAGGCATTFRHKDFNIEVGLHEMDGFDGGNLKNKIFRELGVFEELEFPQPGSFYRFIHGNREMEVPHSLQEAQELFTTCFPEQAGGIATYYDRLRNFRKYRSNDREEPKTLGLFLDSIISDEELKLALCGNLMAFSDDPYDITLDYFAQAQGSFHLSGGVFVRNGSQQLSDYFVNYIISHHGNVKLSCRVDKIVMEKKRATGILYHHLSDASSTVFAQADYIVVNTSVLNVANELLSHQEMKKQYGRNEIGPSLYTLYLCFDKSLKESGTRSYCNCFFPDHIKRISDIGKTNHGRFEDKYFVLTDYSHIDSGLAPAGKSVAVAVCIDHASYWRSLSPEDYKKEKERVARLFIQRMENYLPGFSSHLIYYDSATPLTIERYTLNPEGAIYGFAQRPGKVTVPVNSFIPNLFMASAWDKFGGGFSGVIYSGYFTGIDIMRQQRAFHSK